MAAITTAVVAGLGTAGTAYLSKEAADATADASRDATKATTEWQNRALDYQMEQEKLPSQFRDAALTGLGFEYGLTLDEQGNIISDGSTIDQRVMDSPFYTQALEVGNENIAKTASATGGLRSGSTLDAFYRNAQDSYQNAYLQQLQGLGGLAGMPLNTEAIANTMKEIGTTEGQGHIAQGQIKQDKYQGYADAIGIGLSAYGNFI